MPTAPSTYPHPLIAREGWPLVAIARAIAAAPTDL